jgi:hypothetical protein
VCECVPGESSHKLGGGTHQACMISKSRESVPCSCARAKCARGRTIVITTWPPLPPTLLLLSVYGFFNLSLGGLFCSRTFRSLQVSSFPLRFLQVFFEFFLWLVKGSEATIYTPSIPGGGVTHRRAASEGLRQRTRARASFREERGKRRHRAVEKVPTKKNTI